MRPLEIPQSLGPKSTEGPGCSWVSRELGRAEDPELPWDQLARLSQTVGGKRFSSLIP